MASLGRQKTSTFQAHARHQKISGRDPRVQTKLTLNQCIELIFYEMSSTTLYSSIEPELNPSPWKCEDHAECSRAIYCLAS